MVGRVGFQKENRFSLKFILPKEKNTFPEKRYESFDFGADRFAEAFESLESIIASYEMA